MHIADLSKGMLGANGIVGGGPPLICGTALAAKQQSTGGVGVAFFGDGASNQGTTLEALNLASVWNLPAIFVAENNGYAEADGQHLVRGLGQHRRPRRRVRHARRDRRRVRLLRRPRSGGRSGRTRPRRRRPDAASRSSSPATTGTSRATSRPTAPARSPTPATTSTASSGSATASPRPASWPRTSSTTIDAEVAAAHRRRRRRGEGRAEAHRRTTSHRRLRHVLNRGGRPWHARSATARPSTRRSPRRWNATSRSSSWARTTPAAPAAPGEDDAWGGVLGVTKGLYHKFPGRVLDTPISESAFVGAAIGAATRGHAARSPSSCSSTSWASASTRSSTRRPSSGTCSAATRAPRS